MASEAVCPDGGVSPDEATSSGKPSSPSALRAPVFRYLLGGQVLSTAGDQFYAVALPILLLVKGGGPTGLGAVLAAFGACRAVAVTPGGWVVDRLGARRVMLAADVARSVIVASLAFLALQGHPPLWAFAVVAGLLGLGSGAFEPGFFALLPSLLPPESLQVANASLQGSLQAMAVLAPAAGGVLVVLLRPGGALSIDAATFVVSAFSLALVGRALSRRGARSRPTASISANPSTEASPPAPKLRDLWQQTPLLRVVLGMAVAMSLVFGGAIEVALPSLARGPLRAGATGYGVLLAGFAIGGLVGAIASSRCGRRRTGLVAASAVSIQGVALASLAATTWLGGDRALAVSVALVVVVGAGNGLGNTLLLTLFQRRLPQEAMGRVMGVMLLANYALFPVSTLLAGAVVARWGVGPYFVVAGVAEAAVMAVAVCSAELRGATLAVDDGG